MYSSHTFTHNVLMHSGSSFRAVLAQSEKNVLSVMVSPLSVPKINKGTKEQPNY